MTTGTRRDPRADYLITPENAALIVIDYQPSAGSGKREAGSGKREASCTLHQL